MVLSVVCQSTRPQAKRIDGMFERMELMLRLLARLKLPSRSNSNFPVTTRLGEGSTHSKLVPTRVARDFKWNSAKLSGPFVMGLNPGRGKSLPYGELVS